MEASIIGCHGYLYSNVYLSLHVSHEALCGTVVVHEGDVSFLREKGGEGGGERREEREVGREGRREEGRQADGSQRKKPVGHKSPRVEGAAYTSCYWILMGDYW